MPSDRGVSGIRMKLLFLLSLLSLSLVHEGTSRHASANEIREVINATVQQAAAHLEYKLSLVINSAIDNKTMERYKIWRVASPPPWRESSNPFRHN